MSEVDLVVVLRIKPGRLDDFKVAAQALIERSSGEPGTLRYDWHLSDDAIHCLNLERFSSADAWVEHDANVAELIPKVQETAEFVSFAFIGEASDEAHRALASKNADRYGYFAGVARGS